MENGFFPHTIQIDRDGINYNNSISSLSPDFFRKIKFDRKLYDKFINDYKIGKVPDFPRAPQFPLDFLGKFFIKYTLLKHRDFGHPHFLPAPLRKLFGIKNPPPKYPPLPFDKQSPKIKKPYIFVPLQVHDDSQIILLSPLVHNMEQFVEVVYRAAKEAFDDNYTLVVKEHPVDRSRGFVYPDLKKKFPNIIWLGKYDIKKALDEASLVVSINSTVGLEALIYGKPVVTLGLAFYNKPELVFHANSLVDLSETMRLAVSQGPDRKLVERFLYYLRFNYVVNGNYNYFDQKTVSNIAERIITLSKAT
jgi:capsule polysaccharide modification protein KpsS